MFRVFRNLTAVAVILSSAAGVSAANEPQQPAAAPQAAVAEQPSKTVGMLFDGKHLKLTKAGSELTYRFQRSVSAEQILGAPFSDDIKIDIEKTKEDDKRDFRLKIFTGERARDPFSDHDRVGNPLLLWYLDRSVNSYKGLAGGSLTYVKSRFMDALQKDEVLSEPVKIDVDGKSVEAVRLTVTPYAKDPNVRLMRGYENSRFIFVVSDAVPGYFVEMTTILESSEKASPRLEERISFVSEGGKP